MTEANSRGADQVVGALAEHGVARIFALSGNHIMSVFDACIDFGIEIVHVRHEAAAVHMADAWGRLTGQPGVALVTGGPGHLNAISALYTARESQSPMVLLSGHAPVGRATHGAFQEVAQATTAAPVCKAAWTAQHSRDLAVDVTRALDLATAGLPGPVHLSLPSDLLDARPSNPRPVAAGTGVSIGLGRLAPDRAQAIADRLAAARRPLVVAGASVMRWPLAGPLDDLERVASLPVVRMESPRGMNDPSLGAIAELLPRADCVLLLEKCLDYTLGFGEAGAFDPQCRFIDLGADPYARERTRRALAGSNRLVESGAVSASDALTVLNAARHPDPSAERAAWRDECDLALRFRAEPAARAGADGTGITAVEVAEAVQAALDADPDAILVCDGGEFGQWIQALVSAPTRITNGQAGAIGSALPFAIAARAARPGARVIACLGDGTFGFHMAEMDTAVRHALPFVAVVGNDARWNAEHEIQRRAYGAQRQIGCELLPTRYDEVTRAMGGHGEHVARVAEISPAIERSLAAGVAATVNVDLAPLAAPLARRSSA